MTDDGGGDEAAAAAAAGTGMERNQARARLALLLASQSMDMGGGAWMCAGTASYLIITPRPGVKCNMCAGDGLRSRISGTK